MGRARPGLGQGRLDRRPARGTRFVQVAGEPVLLFRQAREPVGNGALYLDAAPPAGTSQAEEVVRLVSAGARVYKITADLFQGLNDVGFTVPAQGGVCWNGEAMTTTDFKDLDETPRPSRPPSRR